MAASDTIARLEIYVGELVEELKTLGIEENTLLILVADNGPMTHHGSVDIVETLYRGGGEGAYFDRSHPRPRQR